MESRSQGPASLIGQSVGGYRLERILGKGATGAVFLGRRLEDTARVIEDSETLPIVLPDEAAIKILILPWQLDEDEQADFKARFQREAQTLQRLRHPHIVSILDHGEDPVTGHVYMVLPYLAGGTLAAHLDSEPMPLDDIASTLAQIGDALDYAHSQQVVHRDVKPSNILLDDQHQAYIGDFSIARVLAETHTRLTSTGRVLGTPEYMAPEQIAGRDVQAAADIYSLGMVVYRLVTGRVAFAATSILELIRLQTQEPPPSPRTLRPDLPKPAEAAILRALEKDPARRYNSAVAFAETFSLGLQGQWAEGLMPFVALDVTQTTVNATAQTLPNAIEITAPTRSERGTRQRRLWWPLALAALVLLVVCAALAFATPSNPVSEVAAMLSHQSPNASATATDSGVQQSVTQAQLTNTVGSQPTGTTGRGGGSTSGGGGTGGGGNRGGTVQPTATFTATATATVTPTRVPTPTPTTPPPPPKYYETTSGSGSRTWTNYTNAGGTEGALIHPFTTVQVTCRRTGYRIPEDGNTWWYKIAQSPWNNQFYASADNFYNNGQTSGPPNSVFVDTNVPIC